MEQIIHLQKLSSLCKFILIVSVAVVKQTELMATRMNENQVKRCHFSYTKVSSTVCVIYGLLNLVYWYLPFC